MKLEVKIPDVGESVQEALLAEWFVSSGDRVSEGSVLFVLETDKVTLEVPAESDGVVQILVEAGETVTVGTVVALLETEAKPAAASGEAADGSGERRAPPAPAVASPEASQGEAADWAPSVRRLAAETGIDPGRVRGTGPGGRVTKGDLILHLEAGGATPGESREATMGSAPASPSDASGGDGVTGETTRKPMSRIRRRIAERLLEARQNTAMLTTFNEIDMSRVQDFRGRFKQAFRDRYGVSLGLMSFFIKACVAGIREVPEINAFIDGDEIVYHRHVHMGVAIGGERGLVVPVIRYADRLSFAGIEQAIVELAQKVGENRISLAELEGGTFTVSNGGVYGSLLSTPILNPPQSGILGLHKIEERPVVVAGEVVIRPMMYVALSYDHRIIDGREAVTFLRRVKEFMEEPERMMVEI